MTSSDSPNPVDPGTPGASAADSAPTPRPRGGGGYSVLSWTLFVIAIAAVLLLLGGCLSVLYAPVFTGG